MKDRILEELRKAYPGFVSGARLAQSLDISRVAVWKHIETLKQAGYDIAAVKGKGYCLHNGGQAKSHPYLRSICINIPVGKSSLFCHPNRIN